MLRATCGMVSYIAQSDPAYGGYLFDFIMSHGEGVGFFPSLHQLFLFMIPAIIGVESGDVSWSTDDMEVW